ncbi:hypothetical protein ACYSNO_02950 [Enterococcus sp. LJL98]
MKFDFRIKEQVIEAVEHLYDISKKDVIVNITKKGIRVTEKRPTKQTIKWRMKNR